jgi:hypothetical protein
MRSAPHFSASSRITPLGRTDYYFARRLEGLAFSHSEFQFCRLDGGGKRATSSTAASLSVEPSMANKIVIETLLRIFPRLTDSFRCRVAGTTRTSKLWLFF